MAVSSVHKLVVSRVCEKVFLSVGKLVEARDELMVEWLVEKTDYLLGLQ